MTNALRKFGLLLWKNYVLQKRHKLQTFLELMVPVFFTAFLVGIRGSIPSENIDNPTIFYPFDVDDAKGTSVTKGCVILYAPKTDLTYELMEGHDSPMVDTYFPRMAENYSVIGYATEAELLSGYEKGGFSDCKGSESDKNKNPVLAAIIFNRGLDEANWNQVNNIKYSLRFPATQHSADEDEYEQPRWMTELLYPVFQILGPRDAVSDMGLEDYYENENEHHGGEPGYWIEGFLYMQNAVDTSLRKFMSGNTNLNSSIHIQLERMPYPSYIDDVFLVILKDFLPIILVFSFINSVINITKSITLEKEKRLKESMKMMGLPNWLHWLAWFVKSYFLIMISIGMMAPLITSKMYNGGELAILTKSDVTLILAFLLNYAFSMVTLSFFVSTLFSSANSAATASGVVFFVSYLPYTFLQGRYNTLSKVAKLSASLLSNTGLSFGCQLISMWEGSGIGVQWDNLSELASPDDNWTFLDLNIMLLADGVIYLLLALYIEGVWPGEYGIPLPWYFPFTSWYWCGSTRGEKDDFVATSADTRQKYPQNFEKEPNLKAGVQIKGLTKIFGPKTAVNNLYLNMYENQITALLGHNGAGKTTTISMLTGLFAPSSGTAIVNGYDIRTDIQFVRDNLGICPQHNVLFDEMTVLEHLQFFGRLKGSKSLNKEVKRMLKAINLEAKKDVQSMALSGGMKRRLSLALAFVGGSSVVLLDEPTSGLDPGARRQIWDLIQQEKRNRVIIMSSHFMEEADLLGDRIAILAEGQVQCCGSSLFLKKKYGGGYHLIIVKKSDCNVDQITNFLRKQIPNIEVGQDVGSELSYSLPDELSHLFPDMFEQMELHKNELGIDSYGASITTMEEVFMRVGKEAEEEFRLLNGHKDDVSISVQKSFNRFDQHAKRNTGIVLLMQQMRAMIVKKFLYTLRNKFLLAVQTIIPIAFLIITLVMLQSSPNLTNPPEMQLNLQEYAHYGPTYTVVNCPSNSSLGDVCSAYKNTAINQGSEIVDTVNIYDTLIQVAEVNLPSYAYGHIAAMSDISSGQDNITYRGYFNNQPYHGAPVALNLINNALLQASSGVEKMISVSNYPLPLDKMEEISQMGSMESSGFQIGFSVSFGMSFLAASFVVFLIKERETNAKHLQVVSGVRFPIFWIAAFLFDAVNYIVPCIGLIVVFAAFQHDDFKSGEMIGNVFILLLGYGWSVIPFMYLFSFRYMIPASGFTRMVMFNIFSGIVSTLTVTILQIEALNAQEGAKYCEWVFMVLPNFNLGYGLSLLSANHQLHTICPELLTFNDTCTLHPDLACCVDYPIPYLGWEARGIGRNLVFMGGLGVACFALIFIKESKIVGWIRYYVCCQFRLKTKDQVEEDAINYLMDNDVLLENERIRNTKLKQLQVTDNLILKDLTKIYGGSFKAVDNLCLGVQKGECFGLLGINGAGKSTTFKMLTGDIDITSGNAFISGHSVKSEIKAVQKRLGYCPQFDALIPELTGRETIRLFARLRGVQEREIDELVDSLAAKLLFSQHIDKPCGTYSGGNKRKLSTSLALVGNPPMILLDEPTTGMDPVARRHLWNAISEVRESGASIILTSHSMDECEALSTRIAIMVNGGFRCLGSPQHLKNKFGEGYTLIAQIEVGLEERRMTRQSLELGRRRSSNFRKNNFDETIVENLQQWEKELQPLRKYVEDTFPGSELKDVHAGYIHYHIKNTDITWGYMFKKMEEVKVRFRIEAYSVGQTTLEQVFLNFAKSQINLDEE